MGGLWRGQPQRAEFSPPPPPETGLLGKQLGEYRLVRQLGRGGFGTVFLGQRSGGQEAAVKVFHPGSLAHEQDVRRLRREIRVWKELSGLQRHGLVGFKAYGEHDGHHYVVMELVEGDTLRRRMPVPAWPVLEPLLNTVALCHDKGIVHRDLKPENVMLGAGGKVYVMDFGLAKTASGRDQLTALGEFVGTPQYMAPELILGGQPPDPRSDQYAIAVIAHELLTGRLPFPCRDPEVLLRERARMSFEPPGTPADGALGRMLSSRPEERFATLREAAGALGAVLA